MNAHRYIRNISEFSAQQPAADWPRYLESTFNDVDHFGEAISPIGFQLTQLSQGNFQGHLASWIVSSGLTATLLEQDLIPLLINALPVKPLM